MLLKKMLACIFYKEENKIINIFRITNNIKLNKLSWGREC